MEEIDAKTFKTLVLELHKMFPNGSCAEDVLKKVVVSEEMLFELVNRGVLFREDMGDKWYYTLNVNGLNLVSSWRMEDLTEQIKKWTWVVAVLTGFLIILTTYSIWK